MIKRFTIDKYQIERVLIGVNEYKLVVFEGEKEHSFFKVRLQPSGNSEILPSYQRVRNATDEFVPQIVLDKQVDISDWLKTINDLPMD